VSERQWLKDALLSDSNDSSEDDHDLSQAARDEKRISVLIKQHSAVKRLRKNYHSKSEVQKLLILYLFVHNLATWKKKLAEFS